MYFISFLKYLLKLINLKKLPLHSEIVVKNWLKLFEFFVNRIKVVQIDPVTFLTKAITQVGWWLGICFQFVIPTMTVNLDKLDLVSILSRHCVFLFLYTYQLKVDEQLYFLLMFRYLLESTLSWREGLSSVFLASDNEFSLNSLQTAD